MATEKESKVSDDQLVPDEVEPLKQQAVDQPNPKFGPDPYSDNPKWWTSDSMLIGIHVWLYRISKVDVVNEQFTADVRVALSWKGTEMEYVDFKRFNEEQNHDSEASLYRHRGNNGYDPFTDLVWSNGKIEDCERIESGVLKQHAIGPDGQRIKSVLYEFENYVVYKISGEFFEAFELENFPMDSQDLQITLQAKRRKNVINFCPFTGIYDYPSGLNLSGSNLSEYNVRSMKMEIYDQNFDGQLAVYNFCNFRIKIQRKYGVYLGKIMFLMFVSTVASFLVFTMDTDSLADKYGLLVTLLLAAVAIQFVVSTYVPNLPYYTFLDWYVVCCFAITFIVGIVVVIEWFIEEDVWLLRMVVSGTFVVSQLVFVLWGIMARRRENRKVKFDRWDLVSNGYESGNVELLSTDQVSMDSYSDLAVRKHEFGKKLDDEKFFVVKGPLHGQSDERKFRDIL